MKVTNKKIDKRKRQTIKRRVTERWVLKRKQNLSTGFDVHGAVYRNIISMAKQTRCATVSNLF
jgi:glutamate mutase epsilon subunit